jgi:hypothetical protein
MALVPRLEFRSIHRYGSKGEGISVLVTLRSGGEVIEILAQVDTGASNCLFRREHGEVLNLKIENGSKDIFDGDGTRPGFWPYGYADCLEYRV